MSLETEYPVVSFKFDFLKSQERIHFLQHFFSNFTGRGMSLSDLWKPFFPDSQKYEKERFFRITEIFNNPDQKELRDFYTALFKRDLQALYQTFNKLRRSYSSDYLVQIILGEFIRNQFEEGVMASLRILNNTQMEHYDSVFFSLLNYASLNKQHPQKEKAKKIIRHIVKAKKDKGKGLSSDYIFWSVMFGLPDELKYFIEDMGITEESPVLIEQYRKIALQEGYTSIYDYLTKLKNQKTCKGHFTSQ